MSLYFQDVRGYSALRTGLALLPEAALLTIASAVSGRLLARTGPRIPMLTGLLLGGAGLVGLVAAGAHTPYLVLVLPMIAAGSGMALTMPAATSSVMESAPRTAAASPPASSTPPGRRAGYWAWPSWARWSPSGPRSWAGCG